MSYQPPFTITSEILNLVADISQQVGRLDASLLNASPQLRKQNRIKTLAGTLAIEGNTLTEEQITAVIEGKPVLGSVRELAEVKGAIAAYDALPTWQPDNVDHLLTAHGLMMSEILTNAGRFRDKAVGIQKGKEVHHVAPPAHQVSGLMADLANWLKQAKDHPLITSSVFHYEFEFIHPFSDGNGRMGRLWQTLILSQWHPLFLSLPLESVIKDHQQQYYQALEDADQQADSTPFIHFMLSVIAQTLAQNAPVNATLNAPVNIEEMKTPEAILHLLQNNNQLTRQQLAEQIGKDVRTIARAIAKLQQAGKLTRIGSDKTGHWEVHL
ncbi:cell filamentation protein Fic [Vreelandella aquamarina]|jgi:Fic family protein|uniref:Fic family protein n=1 Tax=Vreelandella aquamarina TaxID=77097 RepID=A0A1N6H5W8_9GAMM|nr:MULTISPECIES: Fic family protein [Halomonas]GED44911.1 cell filamentation protein Fic [Halomonas meridiana]SIN63261.1 Fic family protein [Halomonas meridiana]SIN75185.1 Fic family protein [Halomonas meridiana]SIO15208.1 Fic family protein [Halomonas meridiana]